MRWFTSVTLTAYFGGVAPQVRSHRSSFRTRTQVAWLKTMPRVLSGCPLAFLFSWSAFSFFWGLFLCWKWLLGVLDLMSRCFLSVFIRILEKNNTPEKRERHLIHIYVGVLRGFNEIRCHHYGEPNVKQCYFSPHFANCWSSCKLQWR